VIVERCTAASAAEWIVYRKLLWPDCTEEQHAGDVARILAGYPRYVTFLARVDGGAAIGFAEASLRCDYVQGCETSPVAFLEGIYVTEAHRKTGVARLLCDTVERWAFEQSCSEFASDAGIENTGSHRFRTAVGFEETGRVVSFKKVVRPPADASNRAR
jgi:aminoglycoside 6'-N-acetyltransferase I